MLTLKFVSLFLLPQALAHLRLAVKVWWLVEIQFFIFFKMARFLILS